MVLFPFHIPFYVPTALVQAILSALRRLRVIAPAQQGTRAAHDGSAQGVARASDPTFTRLRFPMNFITAPLIADLFLLAILAIGREEVRSGTVGSNHIQPIDIMVFFLTLAYIAISIDASGLIRYLAFRVLNWGGEVGHRLFFYLYAFFFLLGSFIGNDPIILSGTAFLAYMTRVSNNIEHPRAWIHTQFAIANIASAILVSSNPTNLVLAGAFNIKFIDYTANMIVPVVITAIVLFPFLLYIIFAHPRLIPIKITMHELPEDLKEKKPVNPNIPNSRGNTEEFGGDVSEDEQVKLLSLEEIMNPFLDKGGAMFGAIVMTVTLIMVLVLNALSQSIGEQPIFYVTLPAAFIMFCWDVAFGWIHRSDTRDIARKGREEVEAARAERLQQQQQQESDQADSARDADEVQPSPVIILDVGSRNDAASRSGDSNIDDSKNMDMTEIRPSNSPPTEQPSPTLLKTASPVPQTQGNEHQSHQDTSSLADSANQNSERPHTDIEPAPQQGGNSDPKAFATAKEPTTLVSMVEDSYRWCQETFPTVTAVLAHLPFALVPFALSMFVLVEALVTKGWVPVFAYGWDHWVDKTGTVGAIGGMAFLSVILCNVGPFPPPPPQGAQPEILSTYAPVTLETNLAIVRRHQHRHDDPPLPCRPGLAGDPPPQRDPHIRPHILGDRLLHGARGQLRRLQHRLQRLTGGPAVAGYPIPETHQGPAHGVRARQPAHHRHRHGGGLCGACRRGLHCEERHKALQHVTGVFIVFVLHTVYLIDLE